MTTESEWDAATSLISSPLQAAVAQAVAASRLFNRRMVHGLNNRALSQRFSSLPARLLQPQLWYEALHMQQAAWLRLGKQRETWLKGCAALVRDYAQIGHANTMSKWMDQQHDVAARWLQLWNDQATDLVELMETMEVDYGYWLSEKLAPAAAQT